MKMSRRLVHGAAVLGLIGVSQLCPLPSYAAPKSGDAGAAWSAKMQELYRALSALLTDVSSDRRFNDPVLRGEVDANAKKLASLAHDLNRKDVVPEDQDPSIKMYGSIFADESKQAYRWLKNGNRAYARELLRSLPNYCIACHTRNTTGPSFGELPMNPISTALSGTERGDFFAATRQFDLALQEFQKVIADPNAPVTRPLDWNRAVRYSLAISVRVNQNPAQAQKIVESVLQSKSAPFFVKRDAAGWLKNIQEWQAEPARRAVTDEGLHAEAVRLLAKAHDAQRYPADRSADIYYLRASAAVHDLLQLGPTSKYAGEGYLMAGLCYDVLRDFHIGEIHEVYYEACIRNSPHSVLADACYARYEQAIYEGFTGSGGTHLPGEVAEKLKTLERLAHPLDGPLHATEKRANAKPN